MIALEDAALDCVLLFLVRPAGRTHLAVKVRYLPSKGRMICSIKNGHSVKPHLPT